MKKLNIGIVGIGYVGNAIYQIFKQHFNIITYDIDKNKSSVSHIDDLIKTCKFIFITLPTPMKEDGSCDLSNINEVLEKINNNSDNNIVIIKSSTPPGTTESFKKIYTNINIVFSPEFLTERNANQDFANQDKIILGGNKNITSLVKDIFIQVFPNAIIKETDETTAEMVKFFVNCFLATKVSFCNEMYQICEKLDIKYNEMIDLTLFDKRIGNSHTEVPGFDKHFGFGGSCFPANINILISKAKELGIDPKILKASWEKNLEVREEKDWEKLIGRAVVEKKDNI